MRDIDFSPTQTKRNWIYTTPILKTMGICGKLETQLIKLLLALLFMQLADQAIAGARGLRVVIVSLNEADYFESPSYIAFRDGEAPRLPVAQDCWSHRATGGEGVSHTTRKKLPMGLTKDLGLRIWNGEKQAITAAQKILRMNDEHTGPTGYDGMFIVRVQGSQISIQGVGTQSPTPSMALSEKIAIEWKKNAPMETSSNFDWALCKAAVPMDYRFNP